MEIKDEFNWQKQHFILFKQGFLLLLLSLQTFGTVTAQPITGDVKPCLTKTCPNGGIVCVCNATYCDLLPSSVVEGMVGHDGAAVIYSSMSGARWQTSRQPFGQQTSQCRLSLSYFQFFSKNVVYKYSKIVFLLCLLCTVFNIFNLTEILLVYGVE